MKFAVYVYNLLNFDAISNYNAVSLFDDKNMI